MLNDNYITCYSIKRCLYLQILKNPHKTYNRVNNCHFKCRGKERELLTNIYFQIHNSPFHHLHSLLYLKTFTIFSCSASIHDIAGFLITSYLRNDMNNNQAPMYIKCYFHYFYLQFVNFTIISMYWPLLAPQNSFFR